MNVFCFISEDIIRTDLASRHNSGLQNPELTEILSDLPGILFQARAPSTNKVYSAAYEKWKNWTRLYDEVDCLPAAPLHVVVYLLYLARCSSSFSCINTTVCALAWAHKLAGLGSPCDNSLVIEAVNGLKRKLAKPVEAKEPFDLADILKFMSRVDVTSSKDVRNTTVIVLGFYVFFRVDELRHLRTSQIVMHDTHLEINVKKSKCDQLRQGSVLVIAKLGGVNCPVKLFSTYLQLLNVKLEVDQFLFRRLCEYKGVFCLIKRDVPMSYSLIRDAVKSKAHSIGLDSAKYSTHSMRSGGATMAAKGSLNDRLLQRHGRWSTVESKNRYVKDTLEARLSVTKSMC
jgi:integrase